jgi:hypothetical protein
MHPENDIPEIFKPGELVRESGVYRIFHERYHTTVHDVLCICGERFPKCNQCGEGVHFQLMTAYQRINDDSYFRIT